MTHDHAEPAWKIREKNCLSQCERHLAAVNALLKRANALKEKLEKAIETLEERLYGK